MKKRIILVSALLLVAFVFFNFNSNFKQADQQLSVSPTIKDVFSYNGRTGKDALTILKQKFSVIQDNSGLVIGIGGRKANAAKHEYWAFYVNGKMANVGPADYKTTDKDLIEWKTEKY